MPTHVRTQKHQPKAPGAAEGAERGVCVTRRAFCGLMGGAVVAGLAGLALARRALYVEPWLLEVSQLALPAPLADVVRLAFFSDLHVGPHVGLDWIEQVVAAVNDQSPDLVLLGGDFVSESAETMAALAEVLGQLRPALGAYAVLGNHDYWTDPDRVAAGLASAGVRLLINEGEMLVTRGGPLYLAGLDDAWSGQPNLARAMAAHREGLPTLLLQHEPDPAAERADDERLLLQLAGHTHGGQVRLPLVGAPVLPRYGVRFVAGLYQTGRSQLYVTRGVGMTAPAVRFNCPPELTLIDLFPERSAMHAPA